jgi:hypothetical protein
VSAAPHGYLQPLHLRKLERGRHIARADTAHDHGGSAIDHSVEAAARRLVSVVIRSNDVPGHRPSQFVEVQTDAHVVLLFDSSYLRPAIVGATVAWDTRADPIV